MFFYEYNDVLQKEQVGRNEFNVLFCPNYLVLERKITPLYFFRLVQKSKIQDEIKKLQNKVIHKN